MTHLQNLPLALLAALIATAPTSSSAQGSGTVGGVKIPWPKDTNYNYQHEGSRGLIEILTEFNAEIRKNGGEFSISIDTPIHLQKPQVTLQAGEREFGRFFSELVKTADLHYWYDTKNLKAGEPAPELSIYLKSAGLADRDFESTVSIDALYEKLGQAYPVMIRKVGSGRSLFVQGPGGYPGYVKGIADEIAAEGGTPPTEKRGAIGSTNTPSIKTAEKTQAQDPAPAEDDIEVWVFPLKHAWARDIDLPIWLEADQSMIIPGVASILRDVFAPDDAGKGAEVFGTSFAPGLGFVGAGEERNPERSHRGTVGTRTSSGYDPSTLLRLNESALGDERVPGLRGSGLASNRIRAQRFSDLSLPSNVIVVNQDNQGQAGGGGMAGFFSSLADMAPSTVSGDGEWQQTIFADPRNNSVIIADKKSRFAMYDKLIKQLDRPRDLVEISVAIIDINVGTGLTWGVDYLTAGMTEINKAKTFYGGSLDSTAVLNDLVDNGGDLSSSTVRGQGFVASALLIGENASLFARVRALEEENLAQVLSRPSVLSLDNGNAVIDDETTFHVRVAGNEEVDLFPIPVKTRLRVNPHIFTNAKGEKRIRLDVYIKDGAIVGNLPDPEDEETRGDIPVVSESKVSTEAILRPNQSLMVGGRYRKEQTNVEGRVPIIGRIPVLGLAFKDKDVQTRTLQRMFIITPKILGSIPPPGAGEIPPIDFPTGQK